MKEKKGIGLADLISKVKRELHSLEQQDDGGAPVFSVDEVELELQVGVNKEANGGFSIQVVQFGGKVEKNDTQLIRVKLTPLIDKQDRIQQLKINHPEVWASVVEDQIQSTIKGKNRPDFDSLYDD